MAYSPYGFQKPVYSQDIGEDTYSSFEPGTSAEDMAPQAAAGGDPSGGGFSSVAPYLSAGMGLFGGLMNSQQQKQANKSNLIKYGQIITSPVTHRYPGEITQVQSPYASMAQGMVGGYQMGQNIDDARYNNLYKQAVLKKLGILGQPTPEQTLAGETNGQNPYVVDVPTPIELQVKDIEEGKNPSSEWEDPKKVAEKQLEEMLKKNSSGGR